MAPEGTRRPVARVQDGKCRYDDEEKWTGECECERAIFLLFRQARRKTGEDPNVPNGCSEAKLTRTGIARLGTTKLVSFRRPVRGAWPDGGGGQRLGSCAGYSKPDCGSSKGDSKLNRAGRLSLPKKEGRECSSVISVHFPRIRRLPVWRFKSHRSHLFTGLLSVQSTWPSAHRRA